MTDYKSTGVCQECRFIKPVFERILSYGVYEGVLKEVIHLVKFRRIRRLARVLGTELLHLDTPDADLVVPVPLSVHGLRKREFNQSAVMASVIAVRRGIRLDITSLVKVKDTCPQSTLSRIERRENVRGAFRVSENLKGKHVILVDDVVTTGATANECARVLKKAGAVSVVVICAARAKNI